jgi:VWFA-related protein
MYKTIFTLILLISSFSLIFAQEKIEKPDISGQPDFSESTPYQPREFTDNDSKKKKVKKQSKNAPANAALSTVGDKIIKIPIFVYDRKDNPVTDLKDSDIKLYIDGQEQEFSDFEIVKKPRNILLILDTSPSTAYKKDTLRDFALKLIESLNRDDKLQIIEFNENLYILNKPTSDANILKKAVKKIEVGGGTSLYDSLQTIFKKNLNAADEQQSIILFTDGVDTTSLKSDYLTSLVEAEKYGAVIFPFYFDTYEYWQKNNPTLPVSGYDINTPQNIELTKQEYELGRMYLRDIATLSGGRIFVVKNLTQLEKKDFETALKFINPQYNISITLKVNEPNFQRKQLKVRVNRPNLIIQTRGSLIIGGN